jgi:glycosyltransferase involved in cell wall biosynthesis
MRVLHVTPAFAPAYCYGGPIEYLLRLCSSVQAAGVEVEVATTNANGDLDLDVDTSSAIDLAGLKVRYFARVLRLDYSFSPSLLRWLTAATPKYDLIHIHSTFSFPALAAGITARATSVPYVVSPHGSLQDWSLRQKRWKKLPYWLAFERRQLTRALALHATAEMERDAILRVLPSASVFTVPIGNEGVKRPAVPRSPRRVVFLGRIHKKKGFDVLIPALAIVANSMRDVETVVAGPNEDGEWSRVERLIARTDPRPRIHYIGPVYGEERFRLLASAAVFVLPSHSENFGMTVVEAMACRTPVVVSRNCPWPSVEETGAGMWVNNTPADIAGAVLRILRDASLQERMGAAGEVLANQYSWPSIGQAMARRYYELLSRRNANGSGETRSLTAKR